VYAVRAAVIELSLDRIHFKGQKAGAVEIGGHNALFAAQYLIADTDRNAFYTVFTAFNEHSAFFHGTPTFKSVNRFFCLQKRLSGRQFRSSTGNRAGLHQVL